MDEKNFIRQLEAHQRELNRLIHRRLPVLIGRMAKDHFQNNFRLQGFLNNGLTRWPIRYASRRVANLQQASTHRCSSGATISLPPSSTRHPTIGSRWLTTCSMRPYTTGEARCIHLSRLKCDALPGRCSIVRRASSAMRPRKTKRNVATRRLPIRGHRSGVPSRSPKRGAAGHDTRAHETGNYQNFKR